MVYLKIAAKRMSPAMDKDAEFAYGSGQVNPRKAINPGLIYDANDMSYIQFLCHEGYNGSSIGSLLGHGAVNCSTLLPAKSEDTVNYPTLQLALKSNQESSVGVFRRTVTNVGHPVSMYNATVKAPPGVQITVQPKTLSFSKASQKRSFKVVVKAKAMSSNVLIKSGLITWRNGHHAVRTPVVIFNPWAE